MSEELSPVWVQRLRALKADHMALAEAHDALAGRVSVVEQRQLWLMVNPGATSQTPTSPTSSLSPTATPPNSMRSAWSRLADKVISEVALSVLFWVMIRVVSWLFPAFVAAWTLGGPVLQWLEGLVKALFG